MIDRSFSNGVSSSAAYYNSIDNGQSGVNGGSTNEMEMYNNMSHANPYNGNAASYDRDYYASSDRAGGGYNLYNYSNQTTHSPSGKKVQGQEYEQIPTATGGATGAAGHPPKCVCSDCMIERPGGLRELFEHCGFDDSVTQQFEAEQMDVESLMMCDEQHLKEMNIMLGTRMKLCHVIDQLRTRSDLAGIEST